MEELIVIATAFLLGGILKGALGFGAPVLAIPIMAIYFDMSFAVTAFAIPNLLPNIWQSWRFREHRLPTGFLAPMMVGGMLGMIPGTMLLVSTDPRLLSAVLAVMIFTFIAMRTLKPAWSLPFPVARWIAFPISFAGSLLQGAAGLSAPVAITFLSALRLSRGTFVSTISLYFISLGLLQLPLLIAFGQMTWLRAAYGVGALLPLFFGIWIGGRLARQVSTQTFDRIVLVVLAGLGIKLLSGFF